MEDVVGHRVGDTAVPLLALGQFRRALSDTVLQLVSGSSKLLSDGCALDRDSRLSGHGRQEIGVVLVELALLRTVGDDNDAQVALVIDHRRHHHRAVPQLTAALVHAIRFARVTDLTRRQSRYAFTQDPAPETFHQLVEIDLRHGAPPVRPVVARDRAPVGVDREQVDAIGRQQPPRSCPRSAAAASPSSPRPPSS